MHQIFLYRYRILAASQYPAAPTQLQHSGTSRKIIRAAELAMCFGVRDALQTTRQVAESAQVTIHGELSYFILGARLRDDPESLSDADAKKILATIEQQLQRSPNWVRYAMNSALIAIGVFKPALRAEATEAAQRIGKVEVDHGATNCKTPDAAAYIAKAAQRKRL